jgi:3-hydroxyisobutyrate dehydrogenase
LNTEAQRLLPIGFIGLGDQGAPMAGRILKAGWRLHVYARCAEVIGHFKSLGAAVMPSLHALASNCAIVHIMVVTDAQVCEVVLNADDNLLSSMRSGGILIIHSTVHPDTCKTLAAMAAQRGVVVLDAAVSGGARQAAAGELTVMVGGDKNASDRALPMLSSFASIVRHMGEIGKGQIAKLINNYFYAVHQATARDAGTLIHALGVDPESTYEVLPLSSGSSRVFGRLAGHQSPPRYHPKGDQVVVETLSKDVSNLRDLLRSRGIGEMVSGPLIDDVLDRAAKGDLRLVG